LSEAEVGPCAECPLEKLDAFLASPAGRVIQSVIDWDYALERGFRVDLGAVTWQEFQWLRVMGEERSRWQNEEIERSTKRQG
jgi:hypothetical protein